MVPKETLLGDWQFSETGAEDWRDAQVPGHVHCDLMRDGVIEDPFVRDNEKDCQWVDEKDWSYRCAFEWRADECLPHRVLRFEGLDTICRVFLNGELVAEHDSMFLPLEIDFATLLIEGSNELRVDFLSAARVGRERKAKYLAEQGLADDVPNFDERAFVRKAQYMFGWDWGPRLVSCGIWKPVWLIESNPSSQENLADQTDRTNLMTRADSRRCTLVQREDQDGSSFEFVVDGKPFYALGANWIPDHSFPSQVTPERLRERLQQAKDMGMNMLRIWGGGIYEDDAFYDICDELGILVWQDFMFACSYYPDTAEWQEAIRNEAEYQICRLRHHPCIAIWCGNNECHQVWQDGWGGKDKQPPRFLGEVLYHEVLRHAVERLDPGRPYWPGSPFGNGYCNSGNDGDQHYWDVWHGRGDWTFYKESDARFCSEFGFASSPSRATWKRAGVDGEGDIEEPLARAHNKTGKPFEIFKGLVEMHYPQTDSLDEWSYYSQLNQRDAMRAAIEHYRFSGRCKGALLWQLNDCWPVESWSVLEFDGRKKASAYELPRLFAPLLLRIEREGDELILRACLHNTNQSVSGEGVLQVFSLNEGSLLAESRGQATIDPGQTIEVTRVRSDDLISTLLVGRFGGATTYQYFEKPIAMEEPEVQIRIKDDGFELTSGKPCLDVRLEDADDPQNTFEPNFFSLLPGDCLFVKSSKPVGQLEIRCLDFGISSL
jgi:beta-mannosidase